MNTEIADFVSAEKFAALFDPPLSIGFIRKLQAQRAIPFIRLGRRVLFSPKAAREALEKHYTIRARGDA
jgi:hypothetical protein